MILFTTHPIGTFELLQGEDRSMAEILMELAHNRYYQTGYTYSIISPEPYFSAQIKTEDCWLSKIGNQIVNAVAFMDGRRVVDVWDAEQGLIRSLHPNATNLISEIPEDIFNRIINRGTALKS